MLITEMDESMETDQVYLDDTIEISDEEYSENILQVLNPGGLVLPGYVNVEQEVISESETDSELEEEESSVARLRLPVDPVVVDRVREAHTVDDGDHRPRGPTPNESSRPDSPALLSDGSTTEEEGDSDTRQNPEINSGAGGQSTNPELPSINLPGQSMVTDENQNNSLSEFKSPKKYKPQSPPKSGVRDSKQEQDEEAECCPICFEHWTNSGSHRLASLKCGHLFGLSCIEKWLKGQGGKCPHCNARARKQDVRVIYAKALKTVDTSERDRAVEALQREKDARQKAELESAQSRLHYQSALDECNRLQAELRRYKSMTSVLSSTNTTRTNPGASTSSQTPSTSLTTSTISSSNSRVVVGSFILDRTVKISESGGCRVMAYCVQQGILCISQPSSSPLFPGFGVKKLSCLDFKTMQYVAVHSKPIRDIAFNAGNPNGFMLTCSMDKNVKVTSLTSNTVVQSYNCSMPLWSCCWNADKWNYLYAGQQNGTVLVFDMRNTSEPVQQINNQGSRSPVVSLQYIPQNNDSASFSCGGLLVGQLDKCSLYEQKSTEEYKVHVLPADGNLTCLSLEESTRHILTTFRPNARHVTVRHQMSALITEQLSDDHGNADNMCSSRHVHTFQGGSAQKLLSRNRLLPHPTENGNLIVCGCDESSQSVHIWDATTGGLLQRLPSTSPVLDLCPIHIGDDYYLVSLTEKLALLHKWT